MHVREYDSALDRALTPALQTAPAPPHGAVPQRVAPGFTARAPALPAAILFIAGILLHDHLRLLTGAWLATAACLGVAGLVAPGRRAGNACLAVSIVALGLGAGQLARYQFQADHVALYVGDTPRLARMELLLTESPRLLRTPESAMPRPPKHVCLAEVRGVETWRGWRSAHGTALLQFDSPVPELVAGQRLRVFGLLERPGEAMNPGQFDFAAYYRSGGVLASISVDGPGNVEVIGEGEAGVLAAAREQARRWLAAGFDAHTQVEAAVLRALLLGESDPVMTDAREDFRRSGTSHHLAISGMHIAIVGGLVLGLMRLLGFGPRTSVVAGTLVVAIYGLLALPSAPVIRATALAVTFGLGLVTGRRAGGVQLLSASAIFVLLINPLDVYRAGFQLTFVTVLGLMLFSRPLQGFMGSRPEQEADLLRRQRDRLLFRVTHWFDARMVAALAAAVVAWGIAIPLVAVHFGQFNPWAIPASLAASPFVFLSLVTGVLKVLLTALLPGLSPAWAEMAAWPVEAMLSVVDWFAGRPGADVPLPQPSLWLILAFYASTLLWLVRWPTPGLRWSARAPLGVVSLVMFILPFAAGAGSSELPLRATVLAVGAGQCVVIETPAGRVAMIDVGSTSLGDPVGKAVAPFLRSRGHTAVGTLVLSHANWDHYGGAADLADRYGVGEVVVGARFEEDARLFASGRSTLDALVRQDRPPRVVGVGDVIPLGRQTFMRVIWPPADAALSSNDASLVVRLEHAERSILFSGDIQSEAMRRLLVLAEDDPALLKADVLIAPHHGSGEDVTAAFIDAVDPEWVISSNGRVLSQKQRRFAEMTGGRPLLRTHETGAVSVQISENGTLAVETFLGRGRRSLSYPE